MTGGLWIFLEIRGIEPTNKAAEPALRQSVIQRKLNRGVQSRQGVSCSILAKGCLWGTPVECFFSTHQHEIGIDDDYVTLTSP